MKNKINKCIYAITSKKHENLVTPIIAVLISLLMVSIIVLCIGKNPLEVFHSTLQGAGLLPKENYAAYKSQLTDFTSMISVMTPTLFAALSVVVAFKAGLFNIGVSGQMLLSGFIASAIVGYSDLSGYLAKPLVLLIGMTVGALAGGLIGYLKWKYNINEVVSSIMLNYIFQYIVSFVISLKFLDPVSRQSNYISDASRLTLTNVEMGSLKIDIPLGFIVALFAVLGVKILFDKTKLGYEIKAIGANVHASKYAGIQVGRNIVVAMFISGALSGLAGVTYYVGHMASIQPRVLTNIGFDAIAISLLGNSNPIGILFSSFLITTISDGSAYMSSSVGVDKEIGSLMIGMILLFSACGVVIKTVMSKIKSREEK